MSKVIIVGYALNAKKMRKSHNSTNIVVKRSSSENSVCKDLISSEFSTLMHWQGGGLADILENASIYSTADDGESTKIEFIPWNSSLPLIQQPHFDVLIHKLTEDIGANEEDHGEKKKEHSKLFALMAYLKLHTSTVLVDPIIAVRKVTSRARTCATLALIQNKIGSQQCPFSQPKFIILEALDENNPVSLQTDSDILEALENSNINFPVICKPVVACGTSNSHNMVVLVSSKDISRVESYRPCIVQQYFNHDAALYKVYVMDEDVMIYRRKSLPNLSKELSMSTMHSVAFDSRVSYPTLSDFLPAGINGNQIVAARAASSSSIGLQDIAALDSRNQHSDSKAASYSRAPLSQKLKFSSPIKLVLDRLESWKLRNEEDAAEGEGAGKKGAGEQQPGPKEQASPPHSPVKSADLPVQYVEMFHCTAAAIREEFGLSLFGFDVIIPTAEQPEQNSDMACSFINSCSLGSQSSVSGSFSCSPGRERSGGRDSESNESSLGGELLRKPMVIDVNYFPSYKEVSDFPIKLKKFLCKKAGGAFCS